jgi:DNA-binding XRE family transcriptional regulator
MENLEKKLRYTIGQRLMRLRKKKGLSRKELGEAMAINEKTIGKIETFRGIMGLR